MKDKRPIYEKIWEINGHPIHIEKYDSIIIVSDENGNSMEISKSKNQSIILSLYGIFTSGKKKEKTIKDNK